MKVKKEEIVFLVIAALVLVLLIAFIPFNKSNEVSDDIDEVTDTIDYSEIYNSLNKTASLGDIVFEDKVNIYMFWGDGCPHCEDFFNYIAMITPEYGNYFNLYGFEVWYNAENRVIMDKFKKELLGETGVYEVPYIIIGDEVIEGFAMSMGEEVLNLILDKYDNLDSINKYSKIIK